MAASLRTEPEAGLTLQKFSAVFAFLAAFALLISFASRASAASESRTSYSATAYALDGEEMLYVERHVETWRDGQLAGREVRYEDPEGTLIAEKVVDYGVSSEAPSFEMTDYRVGLREGARVDPDEIVLFSGSAGGEERARSLDRPETAVVDAGFDAFMRENFAAVVSGESIEFEFAVPALRRFIRFELLPQGEVFYGGAPAQLIKMRLASPLLRLLTDPIELVYSEGGAASGVPRPRQRLEQRRGSLRGENRLRLRGARSGQRSGCNRPMSGAPKRDLRPRRS